MAGTRFETPVFTALDINGDPLPGAKLTFYENGTTNPQATFADRDLTNPNINPIEADGAGRFVADIFLQNLLYTVKLTESDNTLVWQKDDVNNSFASAATSGDFPLPGATVNFFGTQEQLDVWLAAGWLVHDGNNGTLNLDEQFVRGTANVAGIGLVGGSDSITPTGTVQDHTLTVDEIPPHSHVQVSYDLDEQYDSGANGARGNVTDPANVSTEETGGGQGHDHPLVLDQFDNRPQYTQLIFLYFPGA